MTQIERELAEHVRSLLNDEGRPTAVPPAAAYVAERLHSWGYLVEGPIIREHGSGGWQLVGRLGLGAPGRVSLRAALGPGPEGRASDAAAVAVLLALCKLLALHRLRHSLEVVVSDGRGPLGPPQGATRGSGLSGGQLVGALRLAAPSGGPMTVWLAGGSSDLAGNVQRLLTRYPEACWLEPEATAPETGLNLWVGVSPGGGGPLPTPASEHGYAQAYRLREAAMLGAEIVALLQTYGPSLAWAGADESEPDRLVA